MPRQSRARREAGAAAPLAVDGQLTNCPYTLGEVFQRAVTLIETDWGRSQHGPACPWCALADAKGRLDTERRPDQGPGFLALMQHWGEEIPWWDEPLIKARRCMAEWNETDPATLGVGAALAMLRTVIDRLERGTL